MQIEVVLMFGNMIMTDAEYIEIIKKLQTQVRVEIEWGKMTNKETGEKLFPNKPDVETDFDSNIALAVLLLSDVIFTNSFWWKKEDGWPEDACKYISLNVNQNDILAWGCADAIELEHSEIESLYEHWEKDRAWGPAVWYCKKVKMMPQKPVADSIRNVGVWDIDNMGLEKNPTDGDFDEQTP